MYIEYYLVSGWSSAVSYICHYDLIIVNGRPTENREGSTSIVWMLEKSPDYCIIYFYDIKYEYEISPSPSDKRQFGKSIIIIYYNHLSVCDICYNRPITRAAHCFNT